MEKTSLFTTYMWSNQDSHTERIPLTPTALSMKHCHCPAQVSRTKQREHWRLLSRFVLFLLSHVTLSGEKHGVGCDVFWFMSRGLGRTLKKDRDADNFTSITSPLLSPGCYSRMCVPRKMLPSEQRKYKLVGENHPSQCVLCHHGWVPRFIH